MASGTNVDLEHVVGDKAVSLCGTDSQTPAALASTGSDDCRLAFKKPLAWVVDQNSFSLGGFTARSASHPTRCRHTQGVPKIVPSGGLYALAYAVGRLNERRINTWEYQFIQTPLSY